MAKKKKLVKRVDSEDAKAASKATEVGTEPAADEFEVLDMEPVEEAPKPPAEEPQVVEGPSDVVVEMEDIEEPKHRVVQ
jgi:hypothetical protein